MTGNIKYAVVIKGVTPPFRWSVKRQESGKNDTTLNPSGQADSVEQAIARARDVALDAERTRLDAITEQTVDLFEVERDGTFIGGDPAGVPDAPPEEWG